MKQEIIDMYKHTQLEWYLCIREQFSEEEAYIFMFDTNMALMELLIDSVK